MRIPNLARLPTPLAAALGLALTGCAGTRGGSIPYDTPNFVAPDPKVVAATPANSAVAVGDTLAVQVFQAEALSKDYLVGATGDIELPLIGPVKAAGRTTAEIKTAIAGELGRKYLRNPDVTVALKDAVARNVTVDGSVRAPGIYPVAGQITLIQAVAMARGTDDNSNPRRVAIFRTIGGQRMAAAFDLTSIRRGENPDPQVYAGDIVVVDGSSANSTFTKLVSALPLVAIFRPF